MGLEEQRMMFFMTVRIVAFAMPEKVQHERLSRDGTVQVFHVTAEKRGSLAVMVCTG
jgi:hypothetical protein